MKDSDVNVPAGVVGRLGAQEHFQWGLQKAVNTLPKDGSAAAFPKKEERAGGVEGAMFIGEDAILESR